jgi:hypothetical protein
MLKVNFYIINNKNDSVRTILITDILDDEDNVKLLLDNKENVQKIINNTIDYAKGFKCKVLALLDDKYIDNQYFVDFARKIGVKLEDKTK